jgi:membrane associated rhomboid family serine protease
MNKFSFQQILKGYHDADSATRLIYINGAVFILLKIILVTLWLFAIKGGDANDWIMNFMAVPTYIDKLLVRPWTLFTYMFTHTGFLHLIFNMIALYFGGQLFSQFLGQKKVWSVYINGGLAGAFLYIIAYNLFPVFGEVIPVSKAIGASASIMAILAAVATYVPNMEVRMFFLGNIKLKWIVLFLFVVDVLSISQSNSGGHISHIGGAIYGYFFALQLKKGRDISAWIWPIQRFFKKLFSFEKKSKIKVTHRSGVPKSDYQYNASKKQEQEKVDAILDKISKSGYDSLTKEEKNFLFSQSK